MRVQVVDVDYVMMNDKPLIRIFGKTKEGKSVCVFYNNFYPYFYIRFSESADAIKKALTDQFGGMVKEFSFVEKYLPFGYQTSKTTVLKVTLKDPAKTPEVRDFALTLPGIVDIFEADILFKYRFMCDHGIKAMNWIDVEGNPERTSIVKVDRIIDAKSITPVDALEMSEFRYMAVDIEVLPSGEGLPTADKDPIVMISMAFAPEYKEKRTIVLATRDGDGAMASNDEKSMLERFVEIMDDYDPDFITGYNMNNFDMPYIIDRMRANNVKPFLGRAKDKQCVYRRMGTGVRNSMVGRTIVDTYDIVKSESKQNPAFRFKRFTLAVVAKELLGQEKLDIGGVQGFKKAWRGPREEYNKFVEYARRDAELALDLLIKKSLLDKYIALCRLSGVMMQDALDGGEANRIENYLLRDFFVNELFFPRKPDDATIAARAKEAAEVLKGGLVLEPIPGLHNDYIIMVLDFKSLYPSIIRTFNICPTTLVLPNSSLTEDQYFLSPGGARFVKHEIKQGIVPRILTYLVEERSRVRKEMKKIEDPATRRMMDATQLGLKLLANAFYGYSGYVRARLFITDVANGITSFGRCLIGHVREKITNEYGFQIVYGDTDSVMIKSNTKDIMEAHELATRISTDISNTLPGVLELEYEKLLKSQLILTKKRYATWRWEWENEKWKDKIEMKGIETVRRDWCDLVGESLKNVLTTLLKEGDVKKASNYIKGIISDLEQNKIPVEKLVLTKSISKSVASYDGLMPHVELAKKLMRRDSSRVISIGERISYVILKGTSVVSKRAEDPEYARDNGLALDAKYYLENQLLPPVERIFTLLGVTTNELLGKGRQTTLFGLKPPSNGIHQSHVVEAAEKQDEVAKIIEGFMCEKCETFFEIPPLKPICSCGGKIVFATPQGTAKSYSPNLT